MFSWFHNQKYCILCNLLCGKHKKILLVNKINCRLYVIPRNRFSFGKRNNVNHQRPHLLKENIMNLSNKNSRSLNNYKIYNLRKEINQWVFWWNILYHVHCGIMCFILSLLQISCRKRAEVIEFIRDWIVNSCRNEVDKNF